MTQPDFEQSGDDAAFRSLLEAGLDAMLVVDLSGAIVRANSRAELLFGYSRAELLGRPVDSLVPHGQRSRHAALRHDYGIAPHARALNAGLDLVGVRKNGDAFPAEIGLSPLTLGGHAFVCCTVRDITARTVAAEALRSADERMRFALHHAKVGFWDMDYATGRVQWSGAIESQYGLLPGALGGTFAAFVDRVHPDDRDTVVAVIANAAKSGDDFAILHRTIWPDGTLHWLSGAGGVILGKGGEPSRVIGISIDVTERHTLQQQYQHAQKMEAVGRLAGGVAHDFNNLLTAILGYSELLLAELAPDDPRRPDIKEIENAGRSAATLTRQLLAFSRKQDIEPSLLDLDAVVAGMRLLVERLIGEDVRVVVRLGSESVSILNDRGQVEQIVMNLAVNARDAMPDGGKLTIETALMEVDAQFARTHVGLKPGPHVVLTVSDTGVGMTAAVQEHLFEPFFTTKEPGKGTGLGLATVHGIVTRGGGAVTVYSEVGVGTSVHVYFPRAVEARPFVARATPASVRSIGGATILVVEDSDGLRKLAKRLLEHQGYSVLVAANAEEAVRLFAEHAAIDVLLTDVVMPGASGPELTKRLVEQRPSLRVIFMSGYTEEAIVQHGLLTAGVAFLHKPFTSETLGRKVRAVLEK